MEKRPHSSGAKMQSVNSYRELVCSSDLSLKYQQELPWEWNGSLSLGLCMLQ